MADDFTRMENVVIKITTEGRPYEMVMGDFSAMDEMLFKQTTGEDLMSAFSTGDFNSITVAGLVWLYRRRFEKTLKFQTVAEKLKFSDLDTIEMRDTSQSDDDENEGEVPSGSRPEDLGETSERSFPVSPPSTD